MVAPIAPGRQRESGKILLSQFKRLLEIESATEDAASLTFETVSSLRESETLWTVGARIWAAGAKAPSTDSKPVEEEGEAATRSLTEEEKSTLLSARSIRLEPRVLARELATEVAAPLTLSTVPAGTASTAFAAAGAKAPTTACMPLEEGGEAAAEESEEEEEEFPLIMSKKAAVSRLACWSLRPVLEAQSTLFHSTFHLPSPFIAKSTSP